MVMFTLIASALAGATVAATSVPPVVFASPQPVLVQPRQTAENGTRTDQKICIVDTITGSRIPRRACKTRAQWIAATGQDPLLK